MFSIQTNTKKINFFKKLKSIHIFLLLASFSVHSQQTIDYKSLCENATSAQKQLAKANGN